MIENLRGLNILELYQTPSNYGSIVDSRIYVINSLGNKVVYQ